MTPSAWSLTCNQWSSPPPNEQGGGEGDGEALPISALEHFSYCPRQCGLIHIDRVFEENVHTVRGSLAHERLDAVGHETRPDVRKEYALPVWSRALGLIGRTDLVEFSGSTIYPVEHKLGKKRQWDHETIQLCAQALCLEEMFNRPVERGAIFYVGSRARREVEFDAALRRAVVDVTRAVRTMLDAQDVPAPINDRRCHQCSLNDACLPAAVRRPAKERAWMSALYDVGETDGGVE